MKENKHTFKINQLGELLQRIVDKCEGKRKA